MSTTGQVYYTAARNELLTRMRLREQVINYFIVSAGAVLGVAVSNSTGMGNTIALIIPIIGLGTAILVTTHTMVITNIARYTRELDASISTCRELNMKKIISELPDKYISEDEVENMLEKTIMIPWDRSGSYKQKGLMSSWQRMLGNVTIFMAPAGIALYLGSMQFGYFDIQREVLTSKVIQTEAEFIKRIKKTSVNGSISDLKKLLKNENKNKEVLNNFENRVDMHKVIYISSAFSTLLILLVLIYGYYDRNAWVKDMKEQDKKRMQILAGEIQN